ncbi:hypothetical protein K438DRAFT_1777578 [Mycena galopus ATCC 62051]|nr:hypothetical protein K438DRAFT_1777578 [Mycena galopus ATCC 62051]
MSSSCQTAPLLLNLGLCLLANRPSELHYPATESRAKPFAFAVSCVMFRTVEMYLSVAERRWHDTMSEKTDQGDQSAAHQPWSGQGLSDYPQPKCNKLSALTF